jgi:hypothetical protein
MTADEGVQDADTKLQAALGKLTMVCEGLASADADADALAKQIMESPRITGMLDAIKIMAPGGEQVKMKDVIEAMSDAFKAGLTAGIQATGIALAEAIKTMAE